ncbi:MAG: hypothetical protein LBS00_02425 [Synergistaceae bacterium]|jgi:hypothetical protein|nr:hypothetical protein [Synergistaceae bacterium]
MRKDSRYFVAVSMLFVFGVIVAGGLRMPWSEEGVLYAVYGSTVGFYAAIAMSMFVVWKMQKRK